MIKIDICSFFKNEVESMEGNNNSKMIITVHVPFCETHTIAKRFSNKIFFRTAY
jgi:hypothetical protein